MRERIASAKVPAGVWDAKTGPGRLLDIELLAQAGALLAGDPARDVASGLKGAVDGGWLSPQAATVLREAHALFWSVQTAARLLSANVLASDALGEGGAAFLCRSAGFETIGALEAALERSYDAAADAIEGVLPAGEVT